MTKLKFLFSLRERLSGLPPKDMEERLNFYSEMIEDRMEEGLSEEQAVSAIGSVDEIAEQIISDIPLIKLAKERITPKRRLTAGEIVLLVLGSPVWLSLLIAALAVLVSLYASLWAVIVSLWAAFVSLVACAFGGVAASMILAATGNGPIGLAIIGAGLFSGGLSMLVLSLCKAATNGTFLLTRKIALHMKNRFIQRRKQHVS